MLTAGQLHEPPHPHLELRPFDGDADWSQLAGLRAAVYPERVDPPDPTHDPEQAFLIRQVAANRRLVAAGHAGWFGAFDGSLLIAALGIVSDGQGVARFQSVETHPEYRRRGLARRLLYDASMHATERLQATTLVIVADPDYHAIGIYESLGFAATERQVQIERKPPET